MVENGDILRVTPRFKYTSTPDIFVNNWYLRVSVDNPLTDSYAATLLGLWCETVYEDILDQQVTAYEYVDIDWANVTQDLVFPAFDWPTYTAGILTGDVLPGALCAYGYARTIYPRVVGKKYFNGMGESNNTSTGLPSSAVTSALTNALASGWGDVVITAGIVFEGILKTKLHGYVEPSSIVVPTAWRWLRRRMSGIGG